jgi:hypothetical protein
MTEWPPNMPSGASQFTHGDITVRRGFEIVGNAFALVGVGGAQQPHQQEERHHGGHHVGQRNLPGTTVRTAMAIVHDFLDDDAGATTTGASGSASSG